MPKHLQRDLEELKRKLLAMGTLVEEASNKAITALAQRRQNLAQEVMISDDAIDRLEVEIEEDCLKVLALHQPVASDLRFVIAVLKVNNDLERMGDLAINIAERAAYLSTHDPIGVPLDFERMLELVKQMVRDSLDALIQLDTQLAQRVLKSDDEVDSINAGMFKVIEDKIRQEPATVRRAIHLLSASRHLERIADLATNIAEDLVFLVDGEVIRHNFEDYRATEDAAQR